MNPQTTNSAITIAAVFASFFAGLAVTGVSITANHVAMLLACALTFGVLSFIANFEKLL